MSKFITVDEGLWDKLEAENKSLKESIDTGIRCMEQRNEALAEVERLEKLVNDISYTAKNRKKKMHRYRDALQDIGNWTQETQDTMEEQGTLFVIAMWRGCVAQANAALELGGDAVEGRERVYPEGYVEKERGGS